MIKHILLLLAGATALLSAADPQVVSDVMQGCRPDLSAPTSVTPTPPAANPGDWVLGGATDTRGYAMAFATRPAGQVHAFTSSESYVPASGAYVQIEEARNELNAVIYRREVHLVQVAMLPADAPIAADSGPWLGDGAPMAPADLGDESFNNAQRSSSATAIEVPFGGRAASSGAPQPLTVRRMHRYHLADRRGAFGPGVFSDADSSLILSSNDSGKITAIEWFDAVNGSAFRCVPDGRNGKFTNQTHARIQLLTVFDSTGGTTQSITSADKAVVALWDGTALTFKIIDLGSSQVRQARLITITDRSGNETAISYAFSAGSTLSALGYDRTALWRVASITDPAGRKATFTYAWQDGGWVVSGITGPDGMAIAYGYGHGLLPGLDTVTYPGGDQSTFAGRYDVGTQSQAIALDEVNAPGGRRATVAYLTGSADDAGATAQGRVRLITNASGEIQRLCWTERGADPQSAYVQFVFQGGGLPAGIDATAPTGSLLRLDMADACPSAFRRATTWNLLQPSTTYVTELTGRVTYGPNRQVLATVTPNGTSNGLRTAYELAPSGEPVAVQVTQDGGLICQTSQLLNQYQQQTQDIDENGHVTKRTFDDSGNLLDETTAAGLPEQSTRRWTYNGKGQALTATDARGNVTAYTYASNGDLQKRVDPADTAGGAQAVWTWTYDADGRMKTQTDPLGRVTARHYDGWGRLDMITLPDTNVAITGFGVGAQANRVVTMTDYAGHATTMSYDAAGRCIGMVTGTEVPATQVVEVWTYLPGSELVESHSGQGEYVEMRYDYRLRPASRISHASSSTDLIETRTYDGYGRLDWQVDAYGRRTLYGYDASNRIVRRVRELVVGALGASPNVATVARAAGSNPGWLVDDTAFDLAGHPVAHVHPNGRRDAVVLDGRDLPTTRTEDTAGSSPAITTFVRDACGSVTLETSPAGRVLRTTYGGRNLVLSRTEGFGTVDAGTTQFTYNGMGKPASVTDPNGHATTYFYGQSCDEPITITDPLGNAASFGRNGLGQTTSATDADGNHTEFDFDACGRVLHRTAHPDANQSAQTTLVYDDALGDGAGGELAFPGALTGLGLGSQNFGQRTVNLGSLVATYDPEGRPICRVLDGAGREVRRIDARGLITNSVEGALVNGLVELAVTDPLGRTTRARSDAAGQMRSSVDALGKVANASWDAAGNLVSRIDANGTRIDQSYDSRGRQIGTSASATANPSCSVSRVFDGDGNLLSEQNGIAGAPPQLTTWDARGRRRTVTDRNGARTAYAYDPAGNLLQITDAELGVTQYSYDASNRMISQTFPGASGGTRSFAYLPSGRLSQRVDQRGIATTFAYDGMGRPVSKTYSGGAADRFAYDRAGLLLRADSGRYGVGVTRAYIGNGLLQQETTTLPAGLLPAATSTILTWSYGSSDLPTSVSGPGFTVARGYTVRDELKTVAFAGQTLATMSYDDGGRRTGTVLGNGLTETRSWDGALPTRIKVANAGGTALVDLSYTYDAAWRKKTESDGVVAANGQAFAYDQGDRLTGWSGASGASQSWILSPVGDWTSTTRAGATETRTHSPVHEVTAIGGQAMLNDANGNVTRTAGGQGFAWDEENLLANADTQANADGVHGQAIYAYDALGRRVVRTVFGTTTVFSWDREQVIHEQDAPSQLPASAANDDGNLASLSQTPDGALFASPASGAMPIRINFQPATTAIPGGFLADKGKDYAPRSNGLSYGWIGGAPAGVRRSFHPLPQYDTFQRAATPTTGWTWQVGLPNGSYPVAVVCGDATAVAHTDSIVIAGQTCTDPTPGDASTVPSYLKGGFDLYTAQVTVSDGLLRISSVPGAYDPTLCFIEIGPVSTTLAASDVSAMQAKVVAASNRTAGTPFWFSNGGVAVDRYYLWGSAPDDLIAMQRDTHGSNANTYYVHANNLHSPQAATDASGAIAERYAFDAYGTETIRSPLGAVQARSAIDLTAGFTGLESDSATGLLDARARQYSPALGRFLNRDTGYIDGMSLYAAYFVPNAADPSGHSWLSDALSNVEDATRHAASRIRNHIKHMSKDLRSISTDIGVWSDQCVAGIDSLLPDGIGDPNYLLGRAADLGKSVLREGEEVVVMGPMVYSFVEPIALTADLFGYDGNKIKRGAMGAAGAVAVNMGTSMVVRPFKGESGNAIFSIVSLYYTAISMVISAHDGYLAGKNAPSDNAALLDGLAVGGNSYITMANMALRYPYACLSIQLSPMYLSRGIRGPHYQLDPLEKFNEDN